MRLMHSQILENSIMQYIDLEPFEKFLLSKGLVDEKYIQHYTRWVLRFLRSGFDLKQLASRDLLQSYSDQLGRDDSVADWQLRQAMKAVELYLNVFPRERGGASEGDSPRPETEDEGAPPAMEKALAQMKELLKLRHYSPRTEQTYVDWVQRYFRYTMMHSLEWTRPETVRAYLSYLAIKRNVAASTQNQAFNSILFLFRETIKIDIPDIRAVRAKRGPKLPVVFSMEEVQHVLAEIDGMAGLMLKLTYGSGLRVSETVRLRVQDLDFKNETLFVRSGKGDKDRATVLPGKLVEALQHHLERIKELHASDRSKGFGLVWLPGALARKYPNAPGEWKWQYVFPAEKLSVDPESDQTRRHHMSEQVLQRAIKNATRKAGVHKHATVHTLRHSFATHLLMQGVNIREVQELLGHKSVDTTMIYTHVVRTLGDKAKSPLDLL
jgi:integron integrase